MTISKSNFITISITMVIILILFQFSNLSAIYTSQSMYNKNAETEVSITANQTVQNKDLRSSSAYTTAILGADDNLEANIAQEWCVYTKRTFYRFPSLKEFSKHFSRYCQLIIVTSGIISTKDDVDELYHQSKTGVNIVFAGLPETSFIRTSEKLKKLIGIRGIYQDTYRITSLTVYDGFLLGGKTKYTKIPMTMPFFRLRSGTKTYITGNVKHQKKLKIKNEDLPPLLWRNQTESSFIFVINGDFFSDHTGLGMLTAMLSEMQQYSLYPIVNAQNIICQNFPYLSNDNSDTISKHYYYTSKALCENVLWPDIVSILNATGDKFNGMIAPKLEYNTLIEDTLSDSASFHFDMNEKISGELGISGDQVEGLSFYTKKLDYDTTAMKSLAPNYHFTVFSPGSMPEFIYKKYLSGSSGESILSQVRTLVIPKESDQKPLLSFYDDKIISIANTIDGFSHTSAEDLYIRSIETALGYSCVNLDFIKVFYPNTKKDDWTQLSKNLARFLDSYWSEFRKGFDQITVSQTDERVRNFLALNYQSFRDGNTINLSVSNIEEGAYFMLCLNDEKITHISGASYTEIEHGRYVINTSKKKVAIEIAADSAE